MTGPVRRSCSFASIVAPLLVTVAMLPMQLWAYQSDLSGKPGDEPNESDTRLIVMRDFNRDGVGDIAETSSRPGEVGSYLLTLSLGQSDGTFKPTESKLVLTHKPQAIVAGDFNKDGVPDLVVGDDAGALTVFLNDGRGNLKAAGEVAHLESVKSMVVADFNHDGIADLAVSDWRASSVKILLGTGNGSFQSGWSFPLRMAGTTPHLAAADFNGDGFIDLAVVYSNDDGDTYDVMLGDGHGLFSHSPQLSLVRDHNAYCAP